MRSHPKLDAYIRRIGAEQRTFARWVVISQDEDAYMGYRTIARIKLNVAEGTIDCNNPAFAPNETEAEEIKIEIQGVTDWPVSIEATMASFELFKMDKLRDVPDKDIFVFKALNGKVLFVQRRTYQADGTFKKADLPWTPYSDGEWYPMEPKEGILPLYGLDRMRNQLRVMIHEGASGAKRVQALVDNGGDVLAAHPWGEALKDYAHLGWPGGTDRVNDVDWSPIKKLAPDREVVLVADHDQKGIEAVGKISRILLRKLDVIIFDGNFPQTFDLADPWPTKPNWYVGQRYSGPTFEDLCKSATWATNEIEITDGPRPKMVYTVRNQFAAEWLYVKVLNVFVNRRQTNHMLKKEVFNQHVRRFSDVDDTARLLAKHLVSHCDTAIYRPGGIEGVINVDGEMCINVHRPAKVKAIKNADVTPFLEFTVHLIPNESDRKETLRWCATLIAKPSVRMRYALLLMSEMQGVGKSTLAEILSHLVGLWNTSFPSEAEIVDSDFNGWLAHKRLAVVQEIYSGHSWKAYNKLKSVIADRYINVNKKHIPQYTDENWAHIFACSNSLKPLRMEDDDRRWLIPRVTEKLKSVEYWQGFYRWWKMEDGLGAIKQWAETYNDYVTEGEHAPMTTAKEGLILESRTPVLNMVYELGQEVMDIAKNGRWGYVSGNPKPERTEFKKIVLVVDQVLAHAKEKFGNEKSFESPLDVRKALLASGLHLVKKDGRAVQLTYEQGKKSHVVTNFIFEGEASWTSLKEWHATPADIFAARPPL